MGICIAYLGPITAAVEFDADTRVIGNKLMKVSDIICHGWRKPEVVYWVPVEEDKNMPSFIAMQQWVKSLL